MNVERGERCYLRLFVCAWFLLPEYTSYDTSDSTIQVGVLLPAFRIDNNVRPHGSPPTDTSYRKLGSVVILRRSSCNRRRTRTEGRSYHSVCMHSSALEQNVTSRTLQYRNAS
jgi:hypothetical protein